MTEPKPTPSSSSRRPASGRGSRSARRCCRRRARWASISIRYAAAGPSAGAARSPSAKASSPSTASRPRASHLSAFSKVEQRYEEKRGLMRGPPPVVPDQAARRCGHRRAARQPGAQAGGAQARRGARHRHGSGDEASLHRGGAAGHAQALLRPRARLSGARGAVGPARTSPATSRSSAPCRKPCARANGKSPARSTRAYRAAAASSSPSGPASMTAHSAWRSMSARPRSRRI